MRTGLNRPRILLKLPSRITEVLPRLPDWLDDLIVYVLVALIFAIVAFYVITELQPVPPVFNK
jgi:hypothetical protein